MSKKKKVVLLILSAVILAILCPFSYMFGLAKKLTTVEYTVKTKVNQEIHIVQLSDLHNLQFGENNSELIDEVKKHHPDLIFMTGDMINKDTQDLNQLKNLVIESCKIAPVYFGFGNHERVWQNSYSSDLSQIIEECGATVLENDYVDLEINGNSVRIGGYSGYYGTPHMVSDDADYQEKFWQFQRSFEDTDRLKLLLAHIPTPWVDWDYTNKYDVDVIFSGHYHGGGINVPFAGGLYAPYVGYWPENIEGVFYGSKGVCVLSTGLGSEHVPRFNNPPQIVVARLVSDE